MCSSYHSFRLTPFSQPSFPKALPLPPSLCSQWVNSLCAIHDIFLFLLSSPKLLFLLLPFLLPCWAFDSCLPSVDSMTFFSAGFTESLQLRYLINFYCYQTNWKVATFLSWDRKSRQVPGCRLGPELQELQSAIQDFPQVNRATWGERARA